MTQLHWRADLRLRFSRRGDRTLCDPWHEGPLRVLKALYPEGDEVCHTVIVHPPGGIVGGDELRLRADIDAGAHALVTTPGATRFYRSRGAQARQEVAMVLGEGARLEWLPQETIVHDAARAVNRAVFDLGRGASMIGWDIVCLGLPAAGEGFRSGHLDQHLEIEGRWLDRVRLDAADERLLQSPLGLAGRPAWATAWVAWSSEAASGSALGRALVEGAREALAAASVAGNLGAQGGVSAAASQVQPQLVVVRALGQRVEPLWSCLRDVRKAWRKALWNLSAEDPRVWPERWGP